MAHCQSVQHIVFTLAAYCQQHGEEVAARVEVEAKTQVGWSAQPPFLPPFCTMQYLAEYMYCVNEEETEGLKQLIWTRKSGHSNASNAMDTFNRQDSFIKTMTGSILHVGCPFQNREQCQWQEKSS